MATQEAIFDEMLEPLVEALTPETARLLSQIQAKPSIQARVDQLATKCNEGVLTDEERADYETYVRIGNLLALIKAKAKRVLAESPMGDAVREAVAVRVAYHCEYCRIYEADDAYSFHVEHVIALKYGGSSELINLAYACQHCNLHKGPNLSGVDPDSGKIVSLFHPRRDTWADHFAVDAFRFVGLSATGRATIQVLAMNDPDRVQLRALLNFREP